MTSTEDKTLAEIVGVEPTRSQLITACTGLVDQEVKKKKGIGGVAIKGAYGTVKRIKPKFVPEVVDALLDDWLARIEPHFAEWKAGGSGTFADFVGSRAEEVAEDLLTVTDERADGSKHKTARKLYTKMRPSAKEHVAAAVPELGALIDGYLAGDGAASAAEG